MPPVLNLDQDAIPSPGRRVAPGAHPPDWNSERVRHSRPQLSRQLSPHSGSRRKRLLSSPDSIPEDASLAEEEKQEEQPDEEEETSAAREEESERSPPKRGRSYTEGSLMSIDDNDTIATPTFDVKPSDDEESSSSQTFLFGFANPVWARWKRVRPSKTAVSSFIVKYAPCFWCDRRRQRGVGLTSRHIVLRLIILCALFGLVQTASGCYMLIVILSDSLVDRNAQFVERGRNPSNIVPNLWNVNTNVIFAAFLGTCTFFVMVCSRGHIQDVNVVGSLRFMWFMMWLLPLEIFVTITMFDYHRVTDVWITHWWSTKQMAWFRREFCQSGTYNRECVVPIGGLPLFTSEEDWCDFYYSSAACASIRDSAQVGMRRYSNGYYTLNGVVGIVLVVLLILTVRLVEEIVTRPMVQKSRESNIPLWLLLPMIGCFAVGSILLWAPSSALSFEAGGWTWPGVVYLIAGCLYFIGALLGYFISKFQILSTHDKRTKSLAVFLFIGVLILTLLAVAIVFVASILTSVNVTDVPMTDESRGSIACTISAQSCSFCGNDRGERECPEWTVDDVTRVVQTQLMQAATLAAIFMIYSVGALRFGFVLRKHISMYQIDYV